MFIIIIIISDTLLRVGHLLGLCTRGSRRGHPGELDEAPRVELTKLLDETGEERRRVRPDVVRLRAHRRHRLSRCVHIGAHVVTHGCMLEQHRRPTAGSSCSTINTIQYNTIQYNTIQYNTKQYNKTLLSRKGNSFAAFVTK